MNFRIFSLLAILLSFSACTDDDGPTGPMIDEPTTYTFERDGQTTVFFGGQTTRILMAEELIDAMKVPATTEVELLEMFSNQSVDGGDVDPFIDADLNASDKSIRAKTAASQDFFSSNSVDQADIRADFEEMIALQVDEVFPRWNEVAAPGLAGQIADGTATRYVSGDGLEFDQALNKGLIGALMLDQILNNYVSVAVLDAGTNRADNESETLAAAQNYTTMEHKWDEAYGYLYGTSPNVANPLPTVGIDDSFLNKYVGRVEGDADFAGISERIFNAFKRGRAAIVAGAYDERNAQAEIIREELSTVIGVRAVYYLQQAKLALANGSIGTAFHDLSEGWGFIYSLQFTRRPNTNGPYFSKTEVEQMLTSLFSDGDHGFWDLSAATLDRISDEIAARFDFTVTQGGS